MRRAWLLLALFSTGLAAEPVSLAQAWQTLDSQGSLLLAERQASERALAAREAANAAAHPNLSLGSSYIYQEKPWSLDAASLAPDLIPPGLLPPIDITERAIYRTSLTGSWPIYAGGRIQAAQQVKQAEYEAQLQQLEIRRREQFNLLVERYYGVLLAQRNADLRGQQVTARETHYRHAQLLAEQGQIAEVERLNAQVALDRARVAARAADNQASIAAKGLDSLLQQNALEPVPYRAAALEVPPLSPLREQMLAGHPALALFDAKQRQAQQSAKGEKGRYLPTMGLFGSYTLAEDDSLLSEIEPEWFVGVRVTVPIFTNDGRSGRLKAARSAELEARHRRNQAQQDLLLLLEAQHQALEQAAFEYQTYDSTIALAEENRRLRQVAFQQGLATSVELVDADQSLVAAQLGQAQAQYQYLRALAQVMTLGGEMERMFAWLKRESAQ